MIKVILAALNIVSIFRDAQLNIFSSILISSLYFLLIYGMLEQMESIYFFSSINLSERWQWSFKLFVVYVSLFTVLLNYLVWCYHLYKIYFDIKQNYFYTWLITDDLNWWRLDWIYLSWKVYQLFRLKTVWLSFWQEDNFCIKEREIDWTSLSHGYSLHVWVDASWWEVMCCCRHRGHKGLHDGYWLTQMFVMNYVGWYGQVNPWDDDKGLVSG